MSSVRLLDILNTFYKSKESERLLRDSLPNDALLRYLLVPLNVLVFHFNGNPTGQIHIALIGLVWRFWVDRWYRSGLLCTPCDNHIVANCFCHYGLVKNSDFD